MTKTKGFTLIEISIVLFITGMMLAALFSLYNVSINSSAEYYEEDNLRKQVLNSLFTMEDDIRRAKNATLQNPRSLLLEVNDNFVRFYLREETTGNYQLWVSRDSIVTDSVSYQLIMDGITSPNSVISVESPYIWITLNAKTNTTKTMIVPRSLTLSSQTYMRNRAYGQNDN